MKTRRPKRLFFKLFGVALAIGAIVLGYFQIQWIRTALNAEEIRIKSDIRRSAERALDEAFDEVRVLMSLFYISPENIAAGKWEDVYTSFSVWKQQSNFPELLRHVFVIPVTPDDSYLTYDEETRGFIEIPPPDDFHYYDQILHTQTQADAFRQSYPPLLQKGYFIFPLSHVGPEDENNGGKPPLVTSAFLAIQVDTELLYTNVLPEYLDEHLAGYTYRIAKDNGVLFSTAPAHDMSRTADIVVPVFGEIFPDSDGKHDEERDENTTRAAEDAMRNPVSRFWFLRVSGFPSLDPRHFEPQDMRSNAPFLEIFYPDRSLESAMNNRMLSSLLLSAGTLLVLLASYFVLYILLARTDMLRSRERDFVTSMSHELRTPLSVINATSDNLLKGIVSDREKIKKYGGLIQTQSRRLGKMVESILFYSGLESMDADSMNTSRVKLDSFFHEIIETLIPAAEEANASVNLFLETQIAAVQSDPDALRILSENLIVNAFRHGVTDEAGGEVRVIIRTRPPRFLYLIVEDDGPGVPSAELKQIFEPFSRGERSKNDQVPGSGLGLHIVRRICDKLGGHIEVKSPYDDMAGVQKMGARFTVKIPVRFN